MMVIANENGLILNFSLAHRKGLSIIQIVLFLDYTKQLDSSYGSFITGIICGGNLYYLKNYRFTTIHPQCLCLNIKVLS